MGSDNTRKKQGQIIFDVRISVYKKIGKIRDFFTIEVERGMACQSGQNYFSRARI